MRFSTSVLTALALAITKSNAEASLGFNLGVEATDGSCKTASDYESDLDTLSSYSSTVKTYAVSTCNTLEILGPVCEDKGFTITLGIWPTDETKYAAEKAALTSYLPSISKSTIKAFTVGSESLYRADLTADELASYISEIKDLLSDIKDKNGDSYSDVPVGTVDSWNILVDGANSAVVEAADVLYANAFSYWQGQTMANSSYSFFDDIMQALQTIQTTKGATDIEFWVGETGWPTEGSNYESSEPSVSNAKSFWKNAVCAMRGWGVNTYVFEAFDESWKPDTSGSSVERYWGVWDDTRSLKYDLSCDFN
ncbi:glycoside hydrolase family 17 protein [[Candida] arabinofermentans NRRL YB-2248]|uniref:glucan 1,3-beta-glucosidase n=1 Tax=[Candida] arabinofermentans NRRL YB-2248 TaxID=983967 RepID=A0A1E4T5T1_9ASCO|nr:glycoside hydrolase family 17 protein [[Candida] arabinofermentans NRRL YB-2248]